MNITKAALNRPIFIFMLMLIAFILGAISYNSMRLEQNPDVTFQAVTVTTSYPGASPEDINQLISKKVEDAVSGVSGVREVTSTSQEGFSTVTLQLELGTDIDAATNDVRSKVDSITDSLPKDALKPEIIKFDTTASPVLNLSLSSDRLSSRELRDLVDNKISDRFAQVQGVVSVGVSGGDEREIQVQLSRAKLLQYGLGIADVQRALANASLNEPAGHLVNGGQDYTVRVIAQFETADQVRNMVISISDPTSFNGQIRTVKLGEIANVLDSSVERTAYARLNGQDTIEIALQKAHDGNSVEISGAADQVIQQLEQEYKSDDLKFIKTFNEAPHITDSLHDLLFALCFGIVLVAGIVYVFLHNLRGTIIVALAIPTCIFCSFIGMKMLGFTINNMSMLSLSLAIGVLVDDAIVVLENIYRHLRMGEDPRDAALNGRAEIGLAALAITMADVVVFLPIGVMQGITGQFFKPLALGFVCAVLFSLFVSFTLTPLLASRWYKAGEDIEHPTGRFAVWFERRFRALEHRYRNALEWALTHRWFVFLTGNVILVATIFFLIGSYNPDPKAAFVSASFGAPFAGTKWALIIGTAVFVGNCFRKIVKPRLLLGALAFGLIFPVAAMGGSVFSQWKGEPAFKFQFIPDTDNGQVNANIQMPPGTSLDATQKVVDIVEAKFRTDPDMKYVVSTVGQEGAGGFNASSNGSNYAQVSGTLYDKESFTDHFPWARHDERLRQRSDNSVAADLTAKVGRVPGAQISVSATGSGFGSPIQLSFSGDDHSQLLATAHKIQDGLAAGKVKGIINPTISSNEGKPELQIRPNREVLADARIDPATLASAVQDLYQGNNDVKLRVNGREYGIRVMMDLTDRNNPDVLKQVPITFVQGEPVYLGSVATITQAPGISQITRRQRTEEMTVNADLLPGYDSGNANAAIAKWLAEPNVLPNGVHFRALGQADFQAREGGFIFGALIMGILLVYMLLASLYDNILYPFIIMLSEPQAMVGALLALIITNEALSIIGIIGIIALVGLVGKNAILLVDYTNTLRDRGRNRHDALVEAGPTRLRPIMMTTLALMLGMLPVALAIGRGSEFRQSIGIIIIGGMLLSTLLTLLVIPCSYTIFDDITAWFERLIGKRPPHEGPPPSESEDPAELQPSEFKL